MEIKIYQINTDRDDRNCAFMDLEYLKRALGQNAPDAEIYDLVYTAEVDDRSLEDVFTRFNCDLPENYRGRSLSVSDVVEVVGDAEVEPGFYFCDRIGFQKVEFDASRAGKQDSKITVVLLEPGKLARVAEIDSSVAGLQAAVDGWFEAVYPFEEETCIVCNEEGKIRGMPLNRSIRMDGQIADIIAGPCFVCDCSNSRFGSLSKEQQERYLKLFKYPERFLKINGEIASIPYNPSPKSKER